MSKELEALEALDNISQKCCEFMQLHENAICSKQPCWECSIYKQKNIIETALKENEKLKTSYLNNLLNEKSKEYIYKKLKAFEIIKEKRVDVQLFKDSENRSLYNWCVHTRDRVLTQDEYDLLMEVLEHESNND